MLAVACFARVRINQGRTSVRADTLAHGLPSTAWQRNSAGVGAKGPRYYDWAWIHIGTGGHRHLLVRRNRTTGELAFYLCCSPTEVALSALVRVAGARWSVEECFQAAKRQVGLDHYQVRHWTSWHRHITLAMLALAFLAAVAASAAALRGFPCTRATEAPLDRRARGKLRLRTCVGRKIACLAGVDSIS
ncbi:hypothetical protein [Streptomyces coffeae]|uniref:Transposase n=1 Tax=Streptomyces coffeae TaxID=621382 RepID=A0ABS1NQ24_9ACTN|nr:hypothetical protein [Streptomyces coffeae]MBL1101992.1 hypothetical protein [Streptomyces coffeae]